MDSIKSYIKEHTTDVGEVVFGYDILYLFEIIKRLKNAKVKQCILSHEAFISAYDELNDKEEITFNTHIISLDRGLFYNIGVLKINVNELYASLKNIIDETETIRKANKIKPRDKNFIIGLDELDDSVLLRIKCTMGDIEKNYKIEIPIETDEVIINKTLAHVLKTARMFTGRCWYVDIDPEQFIGDIGAGPSLLNYEFEVDGKIVYAPMMKSFTFGLTKPELVTLSIFDVDISNYREEINANNIGKVYGYAIMYCKNKILEIHSSYILA